MSQLISFPRTARIGAGSFAELPAIMADLGVSRAVLVTDRFMVQTGWVDKLTDLLAGAGLTVKVFADTVADPTTDSLDLGVEMVKELDADVVVALGGGSPIDSAKALAVLARFNGRMRDLKAPATYAGPALPIIAIPTTAGTGSEATQFTIITDSETGEKMLCPGVSFLPTAAILDYELTLSMPPRLTADTGIDALTHAVEAYVSRKASAISDDLALSAIRSIGKNLVVVYDDPDDRDAREAMMLASFQAGVAFSNSSVALVHGMSRPLGAHFHVAHGLANAMLFPAVTEFSLSSAVTRYAECGRALGAASDTADDHVAAELFAVSLRDLCARLDVPTPAAFGISREAWTEKLGQMAAEALASGSPGNNPRVPLAQEIETLYAGIFE